MHRLLVRTLGICITGTLTFEYPDSHSVVNVEPSGRNYSVPEQEFAVSGIFEEEVTIASSSVQPFLDQSCQLAFRHPKQIQVVILSVLHQLLDYIALVHDNAKLTITLSSEIICVFLFH